MVFSAAPANLYWPELWIAIAKAVRGETLTYQQAAALTFEARCQLLHENTVLSSRIFQTRIDLLIKEILQGRALPLGFLEDFFIRMEGQRWGDLHIHCIL